MPVPDFTLCLALDFHHLAELRLVSPTWAKNRPELYKIPWLVFCDDAESRGWWERKIRLYSGHADVRAVCWPQFPGVSQRHRMIAAFTYGVASCCETKWHLKLDTDCPCVQHVKGWPDPDWFSEENNYTFVSPGWGYTRPAQLHIDLCEWAKTVKVFEGKLEAPGKWSDPNSRCKHPRIISYCMFGQTSFARELVDLAPDPPGPSPSHDGWWWYVAERLGRPYLRTGMKDYGFAHGGRKLAAKCEAAIVV